MMKVQMKEDSMQSLQNRSFNRVLLLALITVLILIVSWRLAPAWQGLSLEDIYGYLADSTSRTNASTDTLVQTLQERCANEPQ